LHPLLRQYAAERGQVDPAALGSRLAAHVGHVLAAIDRPDRLADPPTLDALDPELPHLRAAWSWAVQHGTAALLMRLTRVLGRYHVDRGRSHELLPLLDHAVHEIAAPGRSGLAARALALRTKAMLEFHRGALATAQADARQALRWASRAGEPTTACACLTVLGNALLFAGRADAARPHFELALRSAQARGEVSLAASASNGLGLVARARGDHDTALAMFKTAGAAWRDLGDVAGQLTALSNIGNIAFVRQHWADALAADQEYLAVVTRHGLAARRALAQTNLATTFIESGDLARARRHAEQAVAAMPDNGEVMPPVEARLALARIEAAEGRPAQAVAAWMQALTAARQSSSEWLLLRCSLIAGDLLAAQGSRDEAAGLWSWLLQLPQADAPLRAAAERRLQALGHAGPPPLLPQGAVDQVLGLAQQRLALKRP
jgi:tetratricopeptide (TPR) repeat protein